MEVLLHKLIASPVLVCVRLCVGLSPLIICRHHDSASPRWVDLFLALGFSLAGGVLLATVFIHMMPEVRDAMHHLLPDHRLPVTELLVTAGFLLTFLLDEMIIGLRPSSKVFPAQDDDNDDSRPSSPAAADTFHLVSRGTLLSLHGLGQGAAVGLAGTVASTWLMAAAAGTAGSVDSASCCVLLLALQKPSRTIILFCVVVILVMTVGLIIGTVLWYLETEYAVLTVLKGLAAGNLLYQAVYELLTRDVRARGMGLLSLFICLMGFLVIVLLELQDVDSLKHHSIEKLVSPSTQEPVEEPEYENNYPEDNN